MSAPALTTLPTVPDPIAQGESPSSGSARIVGYDLARAFAICGMVCVHFALVMGGKEPTAGWPALTLRALDGRPAALFVILAGVGIALRSSRAATTASDPAALRGPRRILVRRGLFLLVVGFLNLVIWPGDILRVYGVSLVLAATLLGASNRALLCLAGAFVLAFIGLFIAINYEVHWDWSTMTYRDLWTPAGIVRNLFYDGFRAVVPWTGMLVFGMWLGRHDVTAPDTRRRMFAWGLGVAVSAEVSSAVLVRLWLAHPNGADAPSIRALVGTESMPPLPLFLLAAAGTAVAVIAACLILADRFPTSLPVRALVSTGQMAFSWYVIHIVLGLGFVIAAGWDKAQSTGAGLAAGMSFFALAVAASLLWKRRWRHGPLEALLRKIAG